MSGTALLAVGAQGDSNTQRGSRNKELLLSHTTNPGTKKQRLSTPKAKESLPRPLVCSSSSELSVHLALPPSLLWSCSGAALLTTQQGFRPGEQTVPVDQPPSANRIIHILYVTAAWNVFVGKKLLFGRSLLLKAIFYKLGTQWEDL